MQTRLIRRRLSRRLTKGQRQVEDISSQAEESLEKHLVKRFKRLRPIRRFVIGWTCLLLILIALVVYQNVSLGTYYQILKTVPGGIYSEGLIGNFSNANPLYAQSEADATVSRLLFAGLFKVDASGKLIGDLASGYSVSSNGKIYTVKLMPHLVWQDGKPLTAKDVVFTFATIENPDAQSPLFSSWQGIAVSASDNQTIIFKLPESLASFPYNLTQGLVPMHLLASIPPSDLRSADFNTVHPVGAGPFIWAGVVTNNGGTPNQKQVQVDLKDNPSYKGGTPKLDQFIVKIYADQKQLANDFTNKNLVAMEAVTPPPDKLQHAAGVVDHSFVLRAAKMVFFKTNTGVLNDRVVRQALVEGADTNQIISQLGYSTRAVNEPLLIGQLGYNSHYAQASFNPTAATSVLNSDGWILGKGGIRYKGVTPLAFTLTASTSSEDALVASQLKGYWKALGVKVNIQQLSPGDYQNALSYHAYDAVLSAISMGVDPDVFVYWDSSQADIRSTSRLNFSEYSNPTADEALEAGRTRLEPHLRVIKYQPFLSAWQQDVPALGLYQPRLLYLTNGTVGGLNDHALSSATDRFSNVQNWEIREAKVTPSLK